MKNKVLSFCGGVIYFLKGLVYPKEMFEKDLSKRNIIHIVRTIVIQFFAAFITAIFLTIASKYFNVSEHEYIIDFIFGGILLYPLFIFCLTVGFNHYASFFSGKGGLMNYFKLVLLSFHLMFLSSFLISSVLIFIGNIFQYELPVIVAPFIYGGTLLFYLVHAMMVAHKLSLIKSLACYATIILSCLFGRFIFQLFLGI